MSFSIVPNPNPVGDREYKIYDPTTRQICNVSFVETDNFTVNVLDTIFDMDITTTSELLGTETSELIQTYYTGSYNKCYPVSLDSTDGLLTITSSADDSTYIEINLSQSVVNDTAPTISLTEATLSGLFTYTNYTLKGPNIISNDGSIDISGVKLTSNVININSSGPGWYIELNNDVPTLNLSDVLLINSSSNLITGTVPNNILTDTSGFTFSDLQLIPPTFTTSNDIAYSDGNFSNAYPYYKYVLNSDSISTSSVTFNLSFDKINIFNNTITTSAYSTVTINISTATLDADLTRLNYHQPIYIKLTKENSSYDPTLVDLQLNRSTISSFNFDGILSNSFQLDLFRTSVNPENIVYEYTIS